MKTVLIPIDFTVASLDAVRALAEGTDEKVNIVLFHAFEMPISLTDAMMRVNGPGRLITEELRLECRRIKKRYPHLGNIAIRIMYGTTVAAFRNFAAANEVDYIMLPEGYCFRPIIRESVDPQPMFARAGIEMLSSPEPLQPHHIVLHAALRAN